MLYAKDQASVCPKLGAVITVRDMSTYSLGSKLHVVSTSSIDMQVLY